MSFENTSPPRARMFLILLDGSNLDHRVTRARARTGRETMPSVRKQDGWFQYFSPFLWTQEIQDGHRTDRLNDGHKPGMIWWRRGFAE